MVSFIFFKTKPTKLIVTNNATHMIATLYLNCKKPENILLMPDGSFKITDFFMTGK